MTFKTILPGAWEITGDVSRDLYILRVPGAWQQVAKALAGQRAKLTGKSYSSVPVYSLNPILSACFPQIIQTVRNGWNYAGHPWLVSKDRADLDLLPELIKDWLREEFYQALGESSVESSLDALNPEAWRWDENTIAYPPPNNGEIGADVRYQVLPDYLSTEFLNVPTVSFGVENQHELTFYRVVKLDGGAELMSWPPYPISIIKSKKEVRTACISFVIQFRLQTVPWRERPIIVHQLSIRRWITSPLEKLPYEGATAYIGDNRRWLDGKRQPFCFISLSMKRKGQDARWPRAISELLGIDNRPLPDPGELAENPTANWTPVVGDGNSIQAAILYSSRHRGEAPCLPGVSPLDLASLDKAIGERLPVRRVGEGIKVGRVVNFFDLKKAGKQKVKTLESTDDSKTPMLCPNIIAPAVFRDKDYPARTILILWETSECRDALVAELCYLLRLTSQEETGTYVTPNGGEGIKTLYKGEFGSLWIKTQHVEDLTRKLDIENSSVPGKNWQGKRVHLLNERIAKIESALPELDVEGSGGALVEIKDRKSFFPSESDPKLAIRIGIMKKGYLNQHLYSVTARNKDGEKFYTSDAKHRVKRAVSDLFRQMGILPIPLVEEMKDGISSNLWLTCFYILRRTRKTTASNNPSTVAVMIRVNPLDGTVEMTTPSLFYTDNSWVSYGVGLSKLLSEKWESNYNFIENDMETNQSSNSSPEDKKFFNKFVTDCLRDCLNNFIVEREPPQVLFMVEAQNARQVLTWIQNPKLTVNRLPDEIKLTDREKERLSLVRLRISNNGEVPESIVENSIGSRTSGLFQWRDICEEPDSSGNLYVSLRKLLTTEQNVLKISESRLDNGSKPSAIPNPLEIAIIYCPRFKVIQLANLVHNLRERWPYFVDSVSLPFPFPFAKKAIEYAVSVNDKVESLPEPEEDSEFIQLSLFDF
jgi:hypothetical protein